MGQAFELTAWSHKVSFAPSQIKHNLLFRCCIDGDIDVAITIKIPQKRPRRLTVPSQLGIDTKTSVTVA